jgi:hypothetical protein
MLRSTPALVGKFLSFFAFSSGDVRKTIQP